MARCRTSARVAFFTTAAIWAAPATAVAAPAAVPNFAAGHAFELAQYYYAPPRRQVCWNERVRRFVGYDRYGRAVYRVYTQRVCRWR